MGKMSFKYPTTGIQGHREKERQNLRKVIVVEEVSFRENVKGIMQNQIR